MSHEPFIFILSSPSGAGKTTISRAIIESVPEIELSISVTTRQARPSEIDGVDYFFISKEKFKIMVQNNELLEHANIYDKYYYGTPRKKVEEKFKEGKDILFDIDWQGTEQVQAIMGKRVVSVFILPPSMRELEKRLRGRKSDSEQDIEKRIEKARLEITKWKMYDYVVVNDNLEQAIEKVKAILLSERVKRDRRIGGFVKGLLEEK